MNVMLLKPHTARVAKSWRLEESVPATYAYGFGISCILDTQNLNQDRGH